MVGLLLVHSWFRGGNRFTERWAEFAPPGPTHCSTFVNNADGAWACGRPVFPHCIGFAFAKGIVLEERVASIFAPFGVQPFMVNACNPFCYLLTAVFAFISIRALVDVLLFGYRLGLVALLRLRCYWVG